MRRKSFRRRVASSLGNLWLLSILIPGSFAFSTFSRRSVLDKLPLLPICFACFACFVSLRSHQINIDRIALSAFGLCSFGSLAAQVHFISSRTRMHTLVGIRNLQGCTGRSPDTNHSVFTILRHSCDVLESNIHMLSHVLYSIWQIRCLFTGHWLLSIENRSLLVQVLQIFVKLSLLRLELLQMLFHIFQFSRRLDLSRLVDSRRTSDFSLSRSVVKLRCSLWWILVPSYVILSFLYQQANPLQDILKRIEHQNGKIQSLWCIRAITT